MNQVTRRRRHWQAASALLVLTTTCSGSAEEKLTGGPTPSPPDAAAYFLDLKDGTLQRRELEAASGKLGVSITTVDVRTVDERLVAVLLTTPFQLFLRVRRVSDERLLNAHELK